MKARFALIILILTCLPALSFGGGEYRDSCSKINDIKPRSKEHGYIIKAIHTWLGEKNIDIGKVSHTRAIIKHADWYIAEVEFDRGEPGVFLVERTNGTYRIRCQFGGTAAPDRTDNAIREYFKKSVPSAPKVLIDCYIPVGAPFNH